MAIGSLCGGGDETMKRWEFIAKFGGTVAAAGDVDSAARIEMGIDNPNHPSGAACFLLARRAP
jgi:hypothetical protein